MSINPLSSAGPAGIAGAGTTPRVTEGFGRAMKATSNATVKPELVAPSTGASPQEARSLGPAAPGRTRAEPARGVRGIDGAQPAGVKLLDRVSQAQSRMEEILKLAESGKSFTPAELLSLQAQVYRASQELDLAGKVVEKATGGLKQVLQTQV